MIVKTHAQNYQISFAGTGASTTVDSVKVENLTQCTSLNLSGDDVLQLIVSSGINELNTSTNSMHIYPNPMTGTCSIDFEATDQCNTIFGLYDITGKRILQVQESVSKGHHTYCLSGISNGIYTLKIESDKYSYSAKIVNSNEAIGTPEIKHIKATLSGDSQTVNSNNGMMKRYKGDKLVIDMQYTSGDILKLTGKSDIYRTVNMLVPTMTQTVTFNFIACTDADGNNYSVVQIGTQVWMVENLRVTHYNDNTTIPLVPNDTVWSNLTTPGYCWYNNDYATYGSVYGALYNWYTVNTGKLCPTGWHVPSDEEWTALADYLGGQSVAGGKLKETCTTLWHSPNNGATNESGFTALPGGFRSYDGSFYPLGFYGYFWSNTAGCSSGGWYRLLRYYSAEVFRYLYEEEVGCSVRCLKDN